MSVCSDQVFSKVEATLNSDWIRSKGENITDILHKIEESSSGNVGIHFRNGSHVISGSFDDIDSIHRLLFSDHNIDEQPQKSEISVATPSEQQVLRDSDTACESVELFEEIPSDVAISASDKVTWVLCDQMQLINIDETDLSDTNSFKQDTADDKKSYCEPELKEPADNNLLSEDDEIVKEVDPDIWDFIQSKKLNDLNEITAVHGISYDSEWDPEDELYKIHLKVNKNTEDGNVVEKIQLEEAGKQFFEFFQEMSDACRVDEVQGKFSPNDVAVKYIEAKFPNVYLKFNSESIFFVGPRDEVIKAKKQFKSIISKRKKAAKETSLHMQLSSCQYNSQNASLSSQDDLSASFCALNTSFSTDDDSFIKTENSESSNLNK